MNPFRESHQYIRALPPTFWVVIAATLINQIGNMAIVFLILYLTNYVGFTLSSASTTFATFCISQLLVGFVSGSIIDRIGVERVMIISIIFNGLAISLIPCFRDYYFIIFLCLVWGFMSGLYRPAAATFISYLSTSGAHKITFSLYRLVLNLGMSIGPAIGGYLASHAFAIVFYTNGLTNFLAAMILIIGIGVSHSVASEQTQTNTATNDTNSTTTTKRFYLDINLPHLKNDKALLLFVLGMIPVSMVYFQHESTLSIFLSNDLHFDMRFYGLLFTLNTLIIVICELPLNIATLHWPYRINFMLGSFCITLAFTTLAFAHREWHIILSAILWTIGEMILYPSSNSYVAEIAPPILRASYMSIYSTCCNFGMLFGPWAGAFIMANSGSRVLWMVCGLWGMLSVLLFNFVRKSKDDPAELVLIDPVKIN